MATQIPLNRWDRATAPLKPEPMKFREPRWNAAEKRLHAWVDKNHKEVRSVRCVARDLETSVTKVLQLTEGLPFRVDFGRDRRGRRLTFFYRVDLRRWALSQERGK